MDADTERLPRETSPEPEETIPEPEEGLGSEDTEEDEKLRRQRLLSESEEQSDLPSVHDDESSREIFSLIKKVNVATTRTTRVTRGLLDSRPISLVHSHSLSNVQCSFARRTVTTSHATTRQGSGNSRSYVFGRDDSFSNHSSRLQESEPESRSGKDSSASAAVNGDRENSSTRISPTHKGVASGLKRRGGKALESAGPSLIQVLKQQAADLERSIVTRDAPWSLDGSSLGDLSIFSVMRPSKSARKSKA
ncbi:hypothetical protein R1sor_008147 [Riccia sorocarpa]|uniref:Uncharacterized protein n=1 Tax=Riccia sorocarpa TaxID=122646 RepID=A0ABD3HWP8_9MARC